MNECIKQKQEIYGGSDYEGGWGDFDGGEGDCESGWGDYGADCRNAGTQERRNASDRASAHKILDSSWGF
jgi:hypothetical protein